MTKNVFLHGGLIAGLLLASAGTHTPVATGSPLPAPHAGTTWYVKPAPGPIGYCNSWSDPCDLQTALYRAGAGDEIWVAGGAYYPGTGVTATFALKSGVALYGGFAGTETTRDARNWAAHPTILSGDVDRDGLLDAGNAYHVVTGSFVATTAVLDGFTITAGNANGPAAADRQGGGMYSNQGSPSLANITFVANLAADAGGALFNTQSHPTLMNVNFTGNRAGSAGDPSYGGGMYNNASHPVLTNVTFLANTAGRSGGGMANNASQPVLANVTFSANAAQYGGAMRNEGSGPALTNVTFSDNAASESGGGMYNSNGRPTLTNAILWGNTAPTGAQIHNADPGSMPAITYSDVQGGHVGMGNINADPLFVHPAGGNLRLRPTSPAIDAGSTLSVPVTITTDLDGSARLVDVASAPNTGTGTPPVDMGAYEAQVGGPIIYVDQAAPGPVHDGTTWATAFTGLQPALAAAEPGDEIWVADAVYLPGTVVSATFALPNGVALYGGFAGTETTRDARDWGAHPTILSGDVDRNGLLDSGNAYHVLTSLFVNATAVLDGFFITAGRANGAYPADRGGGMYNVSGSPALTNVTFSANMAGRGGGMANYDSSPALTNVTFSANSANAGGGMANINSSHPVLTNVTFSANSAVNDGGGMFNLFGSSPALTNVTFWANSAVNDGGGMFNLDNSSPALTSVTFSGNAAGQDGGGMFNIFNSSPALTNVTFAANTGDWGGAMYNGPSFNPMPTGPTLTNAILWGNTAFSDTTNLQIYNEEPDSIPVVTYSDIQGASVYTGTGNINADPRFVDPASGNLRLQLNSPAIDAGSNAAVPVTVTTDLAGGPRFVDIGAVPDTGAGAPPIVDMGAYEAHLEWLFLPAVRK